MTEQNAINPIDDDRDVDQPPFVAPPDAPVIPLPPPMKPAKDLIRDEISRAVRIGQTDPEGSAEILLKCIEAISKRVPKQQRWIHIARPAPKMKGIR